MPDPEATLIHEESNILLIRTTILFFSDPMYEKCLFYTYFNTYHAKKKVTL